MDIMQACKILRKQERMTYEALAQICGVSFRTIIRWCNESPKPLKQVASIAVERLQAWMAANNVTLQEVDNAESIGSEGLAGSSRTIDGAGNTAADGTDSEPVGKV